MARQLAGCVITDDYDRILLLHRSAGTRSCWELPGGKLEHEETAEAAAVRELREELGISVRLVKSLGRETFEEDGTEYLYHWFQAVVTGGEPRVMETDKFDDLDYFDAEDLMSLALSSNMVLLYEKIVSGEVELT